jgi:hypothetical protein
MSIRTCQQWKRGMRERNERIDEMLNEGEE